MVKTNNILRKAIQSMYKKLTNVQKQNPRNLPNIKKTPTTSEKLVTFVDNKSGNNKEK